MNLLNNIEMARIKLGYTWADIAKAGNISERNMYRRRESPEGFREDEINGICRLIGLTPSQIREKNAWRKISADDKNTFINTSDARAKHRSV